MRLFALGGAGRICREAVEDAVNFGDFDKITIGDCNLIEAEKIAGSINAANVDAVFADVFKKEELIKILSDYDIVIDGTAISQNIHSTECIAKAGCHGVNLNGFGDEYKFNDIFKSFRKIMIPGFGMTPGVTNMMAVYASDQMEKVKSVRISHGAFRPIAFSSSIAETTIYEYDPKLESRTVYESGKFIQVPPFARPRMVSLPEPYGVHEQYIIPHSETFTLAAYLKEKDVELIEVRGTWPPENMVLIKALYDFGFLKNDIVRINNTEFKIMDAISAYLSGSEEGRNTGLYGYCLHVEIEGMKKGKPIRHTLTHSHPKSDGTVPGWEKLRAYTKNVGIPMAIAAILVAQDKYSGIGALYPEYVFDPAEVFEELKKRNIFIHEDIEEL